MPLTPIVMESSDETARHPQAPAKGHVIGRVDRAPNLKHLSRKHRMAQRLPSPDARIDTVGDLREYYRVVKLPDKRGGVPYVKLPDFARVPDGAVNLAWGIAAAQDFIRAMVQCRRQTQVPGAYIAEKMGVAPEIVYRIERENHYRGIKLDTALRYLRALGLEIEIVEFEEPQR